MKKPRRKATARPPKESPQPEAVRETGSSLFFMGNKDTGAPLMNFDALYDAAKNHVDTRACLRYLQNSTGKEGIDVDTKDGDELDPKTAELVDNILFGINRNQSFRKKVRNTVYHTAAVGNYFWVIQRNADGDPIGTVGLHPQTASILTDEYGTVLAYAQTMPGKDPKLFRPEDVIHFTGETNPSDDIYGIGTIQGLLFSEIDADRKASILNRKIMDNDGRIPFIVVLEGEYDKPEFDAISEQFRQHYTGYKNAGRPLISSGIKDLKEVGQSFSDMQYVELRRLTTEKVCAAFGVPKSVLGYRDSANEATAGSVDRLTVYQDTVRPIEESIAEQITLDLLPKCGLPGLRFQFNYSSSEESERIEESTRKDVVNGIMTRNEARKERGLDPFDPKKYPLADVPTVTTTMGPLPLDDPTLGSVPPSVLQDAQKLARLEDMERKLEMHDHGEV